MEVDSFHGIIVNCAFHGHSQNTQPQPVIAYTRKIMTLIIHPCDIFSLGEINGLTFIFVSFCHSLSDIFIKRDPDADSRC